MVLGLLLIMFYFNMENYPVFFLLLSKRTWDTTLKILVTAQRLNSPFTLIWLLGIWGLGIWMGLGLGLVNYQEIRTSSTSAEMITSSDFKWPTSADQRLIAETPFKRSSTLNIEKKNKTQWLFAFTCLNLLILNLEVIRYSIHGFFWIQNYVFQFRISNKSKSLRILQCIPKKRFHVLKYFIEIMKSMQV